MRKYFGTDGIRAKYGSVIMNEEFAYRAGRAIGKFLEDKTASRPTVILGRDTRASGESLLQACGAGLARSGAQVINSGILPSPALAFGILYHEADFGVMITASHNPHQDNGIKCFSNKASKISLDEESLIEDLIDRTEDSPPTPTSIPSISHLDAYLESLLSRFEHGLLEGMRIALDLANGATAQSTPHILKLLGANIISSHCGEGRINEACGSENLDSLKASVIREKADLGIAHDGDGDRVRFLDQDGVVIDGDQILGLLALHAHRSNQLQNSLFVATIHSNSGLRQSLEARGVGLELSDVGDRNVYLAMKEFASNWGGESSGHVIATDYLPTGDGLFAALMVLQAVRNSQKSISELADEILLWPSRAGSFSVAEKIPIEQAPALSKALAAERDQIGNSGRILLRYSGTESRIRLLVEGKSMSLVNSIFENLGKEIQKAL